MVARRILLSANSDWNIANFRSSLIKALREEGYEPIVLAPQKPAADNRMRDLGVERIAVAIDRSGLNPWTDIRLLREYRRLLRQLRPAAYLGYTIKPNIYGCLASATVGIPAIPNVSGLGTAFMKRGALQLFVQGMYRLGFRRAPIVFFQNDEDRRLFIQRRIVKPEQARVLPGSGVSLAKFAVAPLPEGPPVFLLIGRLLADKGVFEFVEAARKLRQNLPGARFQLLGPIDEANRSSITAGQLNSWVEEGAVEYLGVADDVRPFIAGASVVVLPSYREGMPRSLLEGAAMGRPLIATDVPGCRALVADGFNGYLCQARDSRSLAGAMHRMAQLPSVARERMSQAARKTVEDSFSEELVIRAYLDALAQLERSGS